MQEILRLTRQGLTARAIRELVGHDGKTIRKYLRGPEGTPLYGPRAPQPSRLDRFKPYLEEWMQAGV